MIVVPAVAALYAAGTRRAFWIGFSVGLLGLVVDSAFANIGYNIRWIQWTAIQAIGSYLNDPATSQNAMHFVNQTVALFLQILAASVIGLPCVVVAYQTQKSDVPEK